MKKKALLLLILTSLSFSDISKIEVSQKDSNPPVLTTSETKKLNVEKERLEKEKLVKEKLVKEKLVKERLAKEKLERDKLAKKKKLEEINSKINNNIWAKIYENYVIYKNLKKEQKETLLEIAKLANKKHKSEEDEEKIKELKTKEISIVKKLELITNYSKEDPFKKIITPPEMKDAPDVDNPLTIIEALSYQDMLRKQKEAYFKKYELLEEVISDLKKKRELIKNKEEIKKINNEIKIFSSVLDLFSVSKDAYTKKTEEVKLKIKEDIKGEVSKTVDVGSIILFFILLLIFIKFINNKIFSENEKFYTINKFVNVIFVTLLVLVLLFSYIDNVDYLITILGFASAGIAIAMKDWFMSLMGWLVIIFGNSIHVGDRVKVVRDGIEYVGDIIDISLLRITIQEDITLTTVSHNRRAGRIIFIPNNYVFTDMIANYSHSGLKTVWDGIDIMITFDSDIHKANSIVKEIVKKYSKGYTDITRKQINKMRGQYSIKNTSVEPRVYSSIEEYGVKISGWYLTNSFATLTLRSTISTEIIEAIQKEENVHIAYPTQTLFLDKNKKKIEKIIEEEEQKKEEV